MFTATVTAAAAAETAAAVVAVLECFDLLDDDDDDDDPVPGAAFEVEEDVGLCDCEVAAESPVLECEEDWTTWYLMRHTRPSSSKKARCCPETTALSTTRLAINGTGFT